VSYVAFVDPAGGGADEFTLSIGHRDGDAAIIDMVTGRKGSPAGIVAEFAQVLKRYNITKVTGDRYAGRWPRDEFANHRIAYEVSELDRSGLYLEALAAMNSGRVELPPCDIVARQFAGLERRTSRSGRDQIDHAPGGHDAQCAVDTETHIIVTHDVTNKGFDRDQLSPMALAAKAALGRDKLHALADKGYYSGVEIAACDKADITVTMPRPETSGNRSKGMYVKADFKYDPDRDVYICPTGDELTYRYTREEDGLQVRRYWTNECQHCPVKSHCTTGKERRITRWEYEHLVDEMRDRLRSADDPMTLRRSTVEHPFGTIKAWMGTTHFLMRRLKNVRTEMALNVLAYNIKRMVALVGIKGLMAAMPA
jgi:hypothetical protein